MLFASTRKTVRRELTAEAIDELRRETIERYNTTSMSYTSLLEELAVLRALRAQLLQADGPRSTISV